MKKLATLSVAAMILAMTAGCSMLPQAAPSPTVTVTAAAVPSASPDAAPSLDADASTPAPELGKTMWDYEQGLVSDEVFVAHVRENTTTLDPYEQDMLVVLAQTTCAAVANGTTKAEILEKQVAMAQSRQNGELTKEMGQDVGFLLGSGSKNYCPELSDELMEIVNN